MNEFHQKAEAKKYDSKITVTIAEIEPQRFAIYDAKRHYLGEASSWEDLINLYRARPIPKRVERPRKKLSLNLNELDIKL